MRLSGFLLRHACGGARRGPGAADYHCVERCALTRLACGKPQRFTGRQLMQVWPSNGRRPAVLLIAPSANTILASCQTPSAPVLKPAPPSGDGRLHEVKFDGWRAQLHKSGDDDYTPRFHTIRDSNSKALAHGAHHRARPLLASRRPLRARCQWVPQGARKDLLSRDCSTLGRSLNGGSLAGGRRRPAF